MGYLTLNEIPEGRLCRPLFIPDDTGWLALFGGALTELTKPYNYQAFGTLTPEEMAEVCEAVIADWYADMCGSCELPEGGAIMRIGLNGVLEQLIDGAWQPPEGDYVIPPPEARTEPTPDERMCLAAANATNVLKLMYEEVTDAYGSSLGTLEAIAQVVLWIGAILAPGVGFVVRALALAALGAWQLAFETAEFVTADFWTESFDLNMRCALRRSASESDEVVTFNFEQVNEELINQINWYDPTAGSFALAAQVRWLLSQITPEGLNLAGATTAITESNCDECAEAWCIELMFVETGLQFLEVATGNFDGEQLYNSHNTGMGYYEGYFTGTLPYAESTLTGIEFLIGDYGMSGGWARLIAINSTNVYVDDAPIFGWHGASGLSYDMRTTLEITQMLIHDANPNTVGILGIRLRGFGYRPDYPECVE